MKTTILIGTAYASRSFMTEDGFDCESYECYRNALDSWIKTNVADANVKTMPGFGVHVMVEDDEDDWMDWMTDATIDELRNQYINTVTEIVLSF